MRIVAWLLALVVMSPATELFARTPGTGPVLPFGSEAREIRSHDILHRPYRPLHVYGNTVRRLHYGRLMK